MVINGAAENGVQSVRRNGWHRRIRRAGRANRVQQRVTSLCVFSAEGKRILVVCVCVQSVSWSSRASLFKVCWVCRSPALLLLLPDQRLCRSGKGMWTRCWKFAVDRVTWRKVGRQKGCRPKLTGLFCGMFRGGRGSTLHRAAYPLFLVRGPSRASRRVRPGNHACGMFRAVKFGDIEAVVRKKAY